MALVDSNRLIRDYLTTSCVLTDPLLLLIGGIATPRIFCPRLPENAVLPAVSFFTRGGSASAELPHIFSPSVQFDCWAEDTEVAGVVVKGSITAREVYRALYDALEGLGSVDVTIGGTLYYIMKAREEVQGVDLVDIDISGYFRVMTFYSITIRDTT